MKKIMKVLSAALMIIFTGLYAAEARDDQQQFFTEEHLQALQKLKGFPVGAIVKAEGRPELYMMVPVGRAAHIPTVKIIECLGIQDRKPYVISKDELKAMPTSPLLLKSPSGNIYRISGDKKRLFTSPAAFQRQGYDPASVLPMTDAQLNCIKDGDPIR